MLQKILKENTQALHNELENLMFVTEIINKTLSLDQYKKNIVVNYIVHKKWESQLFNALSDNSRNKLGVELRKKLPALEKDIQELDIEEGDVFHQVKSEHQILENDAFVLGALYVLEGATLGGNVIAKNLTNNPNFIHKNLPLNYYTVYGEYLVDNWKNFISILNEVSAEDYDNALKGAYMMFDEMITMAKIYNH